LCKRPNHDNLKSKRSMKEPRTTEVRMEKSFIEAFIETATTRDRRRGNVVCNTTSKKHGKEMGLKMRKLLIYNDCKRV